MNREIVTSKILDILNKKLEDLKESLGQTKDSMKQAPIAMESHSDTSRFQFGQLAGNLQVLIEDFERVIEEIKKNEITTEYIKQGSIVEIEKDNKKLYYYLSSMGLGTPFLIDGKEIRVISTDIPIAKCLLGKKKGDKVEIKIPDKNYSVKIIDII